MRRRILISLLALVIVAGGAILISEIYGGPFPTAGTREASAGEPATLSNDQQGVQDQDRLESLTRDRDRTPVGPDDDSVDPLGDTPAPGQDSAEASATERAGAAESPPETALATRPEVPGGTSFVEVPTALGGEFTVMTGSSTTEPAQGTTGTYTISVEVEKGLPVDVEEFGEFIVDTLNDERSWAGEGIRFNRVDKDADFRVMLTSPGTTDILCAPLKTNGKWSCGRYAKTVLNAERWINGAEAFTDAGGTLLEYRYYLINHEMGHLLGRQHQECTGPGDRAEVMVQQSITLGGCTPNGWPYP